ncbi:MAG: redoxin domain-containing protein [Steroidobacteraceae bacterium]
MQSVAELNHPAPPFRALTEAGARELSQYRGQWLALMYCPRGSCSERTQCLEGLRAQARAIGALGGQLLMLHPTLQGPDKALQQLLLEDNLKWVHAGTVADREFLERYQVATEDGLGHGITGVFLIDPQGRLRAAARYTACAPVVAHEIAELLRVAVERFGLSGTQVPATPEVKQAEADRNYGCVEWFVYR